MHFEQLKRRLNFVAAWRQLFAELKQEQVQQWATSYQYSPWRS